MMLLPALALALGLAAASPIEERDTPQTVHLTFHGGPASYSMAFPADGNVYPTSAPPSSHSPPFPANSPEMPNKILTPASQTTTSPST